MASQPGHAAEKTKQNRKARKTSRVPTARPSEELFLEIFSSDKLGPFQDVGALSDGGHQLKWLEATDDDDGSLSLLYSLPLCMVSPSSNLKFVLSHFGKLDKKPHPTNMKHRRRKNHREEKAQGK